MTEQQPVRDLRDLLAQGLVPKPERMLGQEEKEALANEGTAFIVTDISMGDDKEFGPFWQIKATLNGDPVSFRLSQHERRDPFIAGLAAVIAAGPVGGVRLAAYASRGGNAFVTLEPTV